MLPIKPKSPGYHVLDVQVRASGMKIYATDTLQGVSGCPRAEWEFTGSQDLDHLTSTTSHVGGQQRQQRALERSGLLPDISHPMSMECSQDYISASSHKGFVSFFAASFLHLRSFGSFGYFWPTPHVVLGSTFICLYEVHVTVYTSPKTLPLLVGRAEAIQRRTSNINQGH